MIRIVVLLGMCLLLAGCGGDESGPSVEDLVRRQKQRKKLDIAKQKTPQERIEAAKDFLSQGDTASAESEVRSLLIAQPDNPEVTLLAARCAAAGGNKLSAVEILDTLVTDDEKITASALSLAAQWLTEENEFEQAQLKLERLLDLPAHVTRAHRQLAKLLNLQGRRIEASVHLRALAKSGDVTEKELFAMTTFGDAFIDETIAKPDFETQLIPAALAEAKRLQSEGDLPSARELADRLANKFPESTQIVAFLGRIHSELHEDEALGKWVVNLPTGIEREPEYWFALGLWMQRQAKHREAVRCFGEAVLRDDTDLHSYSALARSMNALGDADAASRFRERYQLLHEATVISTRIGLETGAKLDLERLADILDQLRRPWEAIAWRRVAAKTHGASELALAKLKVKEESLRSQGDALDAERFVTCGIDITQFPIPDLERVAGVGLSDKLIPRDVRISGGPIALRNVAGSVGLDFQYDNGDDPKDDSRLLHQMTGGGIGVIDYDLDGCFDLYFTQGGGPAFDPSGSKPNQLFRNIDGKRFVSDTDATQTGDTGYGQGVAIADINQDGFADMVVANLGLNVLYLNQGDGTFNRRVLTLPEKNGTWTTTIACGDLSGDHLPEIVEVNYINDPKALTVPCTATRISCNPSDFEPASDHVWQMKSDGGIETWSGCQEMDSKPNYGFAAILTNFDLNAGNELFIANDTEFNHFWVERKGDGLREGNDLGNRVLMESAQLFGCADGLVGQRQGSMGIAHGDFDRNGRLDLHVTNFWNQSADLYLQQSSALFVNGTASHGLFEPSLKTVAWGTQAADFDRDGWLDLAVLNGHLTRHRGQPFEMRPQLFRGGNLGFQLQEPATDGLDYWAVAAQGRTMALLDWNHDSKPDLVTNHLDLPVALLENQTAGGNGLQLELVGTASERDAIGATVAIACGDQSFTAWVVGGDGFLCSNEPVVDFGIGNLDAIDEVVVQWPSGTSQRFAGLLVNQRYLIVEGEDNVYRRDE